MPRSTSNLEPQAIEAAIIDILVNEAERPWSTHEVAQALGSPVAAVDALQTLEGDGLVHRMPEGYVIASRAAIRMSELAEHF